MYQAKTSLLQDLSEVGICQVACFPDSFGSKLGKHYVKKSLAWFIPSENRFLFHVTSDDKIVGYCGGFIPQFNGDGSTSGMMRYAMKEAFIGMLKKPWLFFSAEIMPFYPLIFKNVLRKLGGSKVPDANPVNVSDLPVKRCGLVVIGVHPDYRGKGFFESLMAEFERQAQVRGIHHLVLSVKPSNERAINAYKKCGWVISKQLDAAVEMCKDI